MRMRWSTLVGASTLLMGVGGVGAGPVSAAGTVQLLGSTLVVRGEPSESFTVGCSASGRLVVNGSTLAGNPACSSVRDIDVAIDDEVGLFEFSNRIDLRGVTRAAFPAVRTVRAYTLGGSDKVYGSDFNDRIDASGLIIGGNGDDTIRVYDGLFGVPSEVYGGKGNDVITGGGRSDLIDGGLGNDTLAGTTVGSSEPDRVSGRDGNDIIDIVGLAGATAYGGAGDDDVVWRMVDGAGVGAVDLGAGNDVLRVGRLGSGVLQVRGSASDPAVVKVIMPTTTVRARLAERIEFDGDGPQQASDVVMQPSTTIVINGFPSPVITVRVPGGVWTVSDLEFTTQVDAPGLRPVSWRVGVPATVLPL